MLAILTDVRWYICGGKDTDSRSLRKILLLFCFLLPTFFIIKTVHTYCGKSRKQEIIRRLIYISLLKQLDNMRGRISLDSSTLNALRSQKYHHAIPQDPKPSWLQGSCLSGRLVTLRIVLLTAFQILHGNHLIDLMNHLIVSLPIVSMLTFFFFNELC